MIACKKFFLRSLTPILACSLLGGIGFATAANAQATTSTQTAPMTAAQQKAAKKAAKKEAKKEAAQQKATETKPAPMTKTEAKPATPMAKTSSETKTTHRSTMAPTTTQASSGDIASAKAKGMVWVNTESKVYHTGGKYYGNTKHGKFMSAADAQKAGYKEAKR